MGRSGSAAKVRIFHVHGKVLRKPQNIYTPRICLHYSYNVLLQKRDAKFEASVLNVL